MSFADIIEEIMGLSPQYEFIVVIYSVIMTIFAIDIVIRFIFAGIEALTIRG